MNPHQTTITNIQDLVPHEMPVQTLLHSGHRRHQSNSVHMPPVIDRDLCQIALCMLRNRVIRANKPSWEQITLTITPRLAHNSSQKGRIYTFHLPFHLNSNPLGRASHLMEEEAN